MSEELYWLTLTVFMTAIFWMPYILNRFYEMGILEAIMNPNTDSAPKALWARRMMAAHRNAVENLVVFVPLVLIVQITGTNSSISASATAVYFFTRFAHYIVYSFGVPALRTVAFLIGFACQITLALTALKFI